MKVAIVLPTRGLVFTEVEEAIELMRSYCDVRVFRTRNLPIPDAQNTLIELALAVNPDYVLFLEEDTVPPKEALNALVKANADIAFIDYGVNGWSCSARLKNGTILWCGFGCTLVKASVFKKLNKPYFRTDKSFRLNDWKWIDTPMKYGGQDIWFCMKARERGFQLGQVQGECKHLAMAKEGIAGINSGQHVIVQKSTIKKWQIIDMPDSLTEQLEIANVETIGNNPQAV